MPEKRRSFASEGFSSDSGKPLLIFYNLPNVDQGGLVVSKIDLQPKAVLVLDNCAYHRVFDPSVMQIDTDFVTGPEVPVWLFLARHGGKFYSRLP